MFEDFQKAEKPPQELGRTAVSLSAAVVIFVLIMGGLAAAIATARAVVNRERDIEVHFEDLPMPEVEPRPQPEPVVPPPPAAVQRPRARTVSNQAPTDIPDERPEEAEGDLAEADNVGPLDGFTDGGEESELPPPAPLVVDEPAIPSPRQERETITPPRLVRGCRSIEQEELRSQAATIRIEVRLVVSATGEILSANVLESHPLLSEESILACAREQVFEPAQLSDGTPVPYPYRLRFVFRPDRSA